MATPYRPKLLPPEVAAALTPYAPYRTTTAVRALVDAMPAPPAEALVCLADLQWHDALATEFDEDVLQFGGEALATLTRAPELATHAGARRLRATIERRCKAAQRAIAKIMKLAALPEETLPIDDATELVFQILDNSGSSRELLRKAHRLAQRCVRELPDVVVRDGVEFHGKHLYCSSDAATAAWRAGDHDLARPLLHAVATWPVDRDVHLYEFAVQGAAQLLLLDAITRADHADVARWLRHLHDRLPQVGRPATVDRETATATLAYIATHPALPIDAIDALVALCAASPHLALDDAAAATLASLRAHRA